MNSDSGNGEWRVATRKNKTIPVNRDLKITDIFEPVQYYKNNATFDGHASGINFKIMELFNKDKPKDKPIVASWENEKACYSGGGFVGATETSRACSEPRALDAITGNRGNCNVMRGSRLDRLLSSYVLQHKKVSTPSPFQDLRLKINIRNSSRPPCVATTRDNPGIPCNTYLANFTQSVARQYPGLGVRVKVANPSVEYRTYHSRTGGFKCENTKGGVTRYGYGNDRDGFNKKGKDTMGETNTSRGR